MAGIDKTFSQLRTELDTRLNDTGNTTWSSNFKDEFMYEALLDPYVYKITRDKTITTVAPTSGTTNGIEYPIPSGVDGVVWIGLDINKDGNTHKLAEEAWDVVDGTIVFDPFYYNAIPVGVTMIVAGPYHLTSNDLIPANLQEYVLQLSMLNAYEWLSNELGSTYLTNDMTMADLLNKKASHERRVAELRRTLANRYVVRF